MDSLAIADAIAARFTGVTATFDGQTEALEQCTARIPNDIGRGPVLLVYPPTGVLDVNMRRRADLLDYPVELLRDPLNYPERTGWLYAWFDAMRDRVEARMTLGLAYVAWAAPVTMMAGLDGGDFGDRKAAFDHVLLTVRVRLDEVVTTLAP